jgi:hypothetical protein
MHKVTTQMPADMLTKMKMSRLLKVDMFAAGMITPQRSRTFRRAGLNFLMIHFNNFVEYVAKGVC